MNSELDDIVDKINIISRLSHLGYQAILGKSMIETDHSLICRVYFKLLKNYTTPLPLEYTILEE